MVFERGNKISQKKLGFKPNQMTIKPLRQTGKPPTPGLILIKERTSLPNKNLSFGLIIW